jgi:hypothetical protein
MLAAGSQGRGARWRGRARGPDRWERMHDYMEVARLKMMVVRVESISRTMLRGLRDWGCRSELMVVVLCTA